MHGGRSVENNRIGVAGKIKNPQDLINLKINIPEHITIKRAINKKTRSYTIVRLGKVVDNFSIPYYAEKNNLHIFATNKTHKSRFITTRHERHHVATQSVDGSYLSKKTGTDD